MALFRVRILVFFAAALGLCPVSAQADSEPAVAAARLDLLYVLVQNGLITREQASAVAAGSPAPVRTVVPGTKVVSKLSLSGRVQAQFAAFSTDQTGANDPASTSYFWLRRVYLMTKAELGPDWQASLTYNFVNSVFDVATVQWKGDDLAVELGYRMVNLGREQRTPGGVLKGIERSAATRYFAESNNGTRLGGGGYRVGLFADGKHGDAFWGAALTNPEQPTSLSALGGAGGASNNQPAVWLNGGLDKATSRSRLVVGAGLGWLPEQGGRVPGAGDDLIAGTAYADYVAGGFSLLVEVLAGLVERGGWDGDDSRVCGGFVQPAWAFTPKLEGVFRIGFIDTDGHGVTVLDAVPSGPLTAAQDRLWDAFLGGSWMIKGHDLKFQAGFTYAVGEDTPSGVDLRTETFGFRSQMQVNF